MFSSQKGRTQQKLAEMFLSCKIDSRIPTFSELQKILNVGTGTIQSAIKDFEQADIIELQAQPRYGTILIKKNIQKLWEFLPNRHLVGLFPEPLSLEMRGLAMGLRSTLNDYNIPLVIVYGYGSKVRFDRILEDNSTEDFVISSLASANERRKNPSNLEITISLGPNSFYDKDSLVLLEHNANHTKSDSELRVGIDYSSYDQAALTKELYPNSQFVEVKYADIPFEILSQNIDCAVWHKTQQQKYFNNTPIKTKIITQDMLKAVNLAAISEAVVTTNSDNKMIEDLLTHIDICKVRNIQNSVLQEELNAIF
jgi:hypothetical protein